jgi:hypothetical protein
MYRRDFAMILIEGIPIVAARLAAEQKAKDWLAKTRRNAPKPADQRSSTARPSSSVTRAAKAA